MTDELEALFDQISAENQLPATASNSEKTASSESSEDELEALFDQISAETLPVAAATAATDNEKTANAEPAEDELEALFDQISAETMPAAAAAPDNEKTANAEPAEDELEALFDQISAETLPVASAETAADTTPAVAMMETAAATGLEEASPLDASHPRNSPDSPLYDRVGGILRLLHDSMRELGLDRALQEVSSEVMDAKGRLEYVASLTEQAATRVLNSIDIGMPQQEELSKNAHHIDQRWAKIFEGEGDLDSFKQLAQDSRLFAQHVAQKADEEKARLMEIMMAQDFQDITGQVIKKVVVITKKLEQELAQLLRDNAPAGVKERTVDLMDGPDIPTKAMVQDDVDDLLATLGF